MYWHIEGPGRHIVISWSQDDGLTINGSGRLKGFLEDPDHPFFRGDEEVFESQTANMAFCWHIGSIERALAADPMWADANCPDALKHLQARRPEAVLARAVFVPAHPPYLPDPVIEIRILVQGEQRLSQLHSLCELAFGVSRSTVSVQLNMLGFYGSDPPGPGIGIPRPTDVTPVFDPAIRTDSHGLG
jgi:hypothetical protein